MDHRKQRHRPPSAIPQPAQFQMTEPGEHEHAILTRVFGDPVIDFFRLPWFD
jgi:hypothetical protein